jgi:hypothetical protein
MKTYLSTAALAVLLISGAAIADGPGMKGSRSSDSSMSGPRSHMQSDDKHHMDKDEYAGKGREYSSDRYDDDEDQRGENHRGEARHDDDDRQHRMKHMGRGHS